MGIFGDITRSLFGGGKSNSESGNRFADDTKAQFDPWVAQGGQSMGAMSNILGFGGPEARSAALGDWWDSSGGDFMLNQGMDQIIGNRAAGGLLRSGGTSKAIENYRSDLASTKMGEGMGYMSDMARLGLGAGGLVSGAGSYSEGESRESKGGLGKLLGAIMASDPRLKTNIVKVGEKPDGLGIYEYDYLPIEGQIAAFMPEGRQRGVMADEVARLRPQALGPVVDGYNTVNYAEIG